jgi:hypothetical protein
MNLAAIKEAEREAERFLSRVADLDDAVLESGSEFHTVQLGSLESGAVRRASMDLTRALSKMRASK